MLKEFRSFWNEIMKRKTKTEARINYVSKVLEVAFEEVDLDMPNINISSIVAGSKLLHTVTAISTDGMMAEALINGKKPISVRLSYKKIVASEICALTSLIDALQNIKDLFFDNCEGEK